MIQLFASPVTGPGPGLFATGPNAVPTSVARATTDSEIVPRARVLVVDDDPTYSALLEATLAEQGYSTRTLGNLDQLISTVQEFQPQVILLDLYIGSVYAVDLLSTLRHSIPDAGIVMISAQKTPEAAFHALYEGAIDFLEKPLIAPVVDLRIRTILKRQKYRDEIRQISADLEKDKRRLLRYFPLQIAEEILSGRSKTHSQGITVDATVMFVGIKGTDRILRDKSPAEFAAFLNEILADAMDLITATGGSINKLRGAGFLATFGLPVPSKDDARNALEAAQRIREHFRLLESTQVFEGSQPGVGIGIGITSGEFFAGNIGNFRRMEYSLVGDCLNVASRLEALAGPVRGEILLDRRTVERSGCKEAEELPETRIRGRRGEVKIFRI